MNCFNSNKGENINILGARGVFSCILFALYSDFIDLIILNLLCPLVPKEDFIFLCFSPRNSCVFHQ